MIWPFKKKQTVEFKLPEFSSVRFVDTDGTSYEYSPTAHITAHEVAMLLPLFTAVFMRADRFAYIRKHNLIRHFVKVSDDEIQV